MHVDVQIAVTPDVCPERFEATERSYAEGKQKPVPPGPTNINDISGLLSRLPEAEAQCIRSSVLVHGQVLTSARNGDFAKAERLLNAEMDVHLSQESEKRAGNHRNGSTSKTMLGDDGEVVLSIPRDRHGRFDPP